MIIEKLTNEQLALVVTHYIYRNTNIIENSHSNGVCMSENFYKATHKVVARNINYAKKFLKLLKSCNNENELKNKSQNLDANSGFAFINFLGEIVLPYGTNWDKPVLVNQIPSANMASYILDGKFKEYCDKNAVLSDLAMKNINKDVYNKVYTLFERNMIC